MIHLIDLQMFACIILLFLLKTYGIKKSFNGDSSNIFRWILYTTLFMTVLEGVYVFFTYHEYKVSGLFLHIFHTFNPIGISFSISLWFLYLDFVYTKNYQGAIDHFKKYLISPFTITIIMFVNIFFPFVYTLDDELQPHNKWGLFLVIGVLYLNSLAAIIYCIKEKIHISRKLIKSLLLIGTLPVFGSFIQMIEPSAIVFWPSMCMVVILVYTYVERNRLLRDPLTGVITRGELEERVQHNLDHQRPFTLLLLDMDDFKQINDQYGHNEGDIALKTMVEIILSNIKNIDTLSRYGGDEFSILIESDDPVAGDLLIGRINEAIEKYNKMAIKPYELSVSIGSVFVEENSRLNIVELLGKADELMYVNKKMKKLS